MRKPLLTLAALLTLTGGLTGCAASHHPAAAPTTAAPDPGRAPAQVRWEPFQGIALPYSPVDGPTQTAAATGYSRSPQGAVLAAIQDSIRTSASPDSSWASFASTSLVAGPGKDNWILARTRISITAPTDPKLAPVVVGYRFGSYTPDKADITVYTRFSDASLAAYRQVVEWQAGDWRLLLPDPATKTVTMQSVSALPADVLRFEATR
ncbi:hypothetical protein [Nocardia sp. NBC_00511]|uniref:hypothetical protein n=1 Tax=Nocardia sp. NBC_00511 TaxID=2903591 RepID=UPI002F916393